MKRLFFAIAVLFMAVSCEGPAEQQETEAEEPLAEEDVTRNAADDEPEEPSGPITRNLYTVGEQLTTMTFEPTRLEVRPGAQVTIVLMNKAKSEAMLHNAVFIRAGSQEYVLDAALEAGPDKNYIPISSDIIAHTPLAKPGETVKVSFTAPEQKGSYPFICTYPGHEKMKGLLLVK